MARQADRAAQQPGHVQRQQRSGVEVAKRRRALAEHPGLAKGVNTQAGRVVCEAGAQALGFGRVR